MNITWATFQIGSPLAWVSYIKHSWCDYQSLINHNEPTKFSRASSPGMYTNLFRVDATGLSKRAFIKLFRPVVVGIFFSILALIMNEVNHKYLLLHASINTILSILNSNTTFHSMEPACIDRHSALKLEKIYTQFLATKNLVRAYHECRI